MRTRIGDWRSKEGVPAWKPTWVASTVYCGQIKDAEGNYQGVCDHDPNNLPNPQKFLAHASNMENARAQDEANRRLHEEQMRLEQERLYNEKHAAAKLAREELRKEEDRRRAQEEERRRQEMELQREAER